MDTKLIKLLTDFEEVLKDWRAGLIESEEKFKERVKELVVGISEQLGQETAED